MTPSVASKYAPSRTTPSLRRSPRSSFLLALRHLSLLSRHAQLAIAIALATSWLSCAETTGSGWMSRPMTSPDDTPPIDEPHKKSSGYTMDTRTRVIGGDSASDEDDEPSTHEEHRAESVAGQSIGVFRNTYYSFPQEADYSGAKTTVFDASCKPIASVPTTFHDKVCVQGSGRLASGQTISFAKRNCTCAAECPRSKQKICYEALSPTQFPYGRGALGKPITPFRTIAVDSAVVTLDTAVYMPAFVGLPLPDGGKHDGCFFAEDRGMKVVGKSVDVFAGSEGDLARWNKLVPTAQGVEMFVGHPRCDALLASKRQR